MGDLCRATVALLRVQRHRGFCFLFSVQNPTLATAKFPMRACPDAGATRFHAL